MHVVEYSSGQSHVYSSHMIHIMEVGVAILGCCGAQAAMYLVVPYGVKAQQGMLLCIIHVHSLNVSNASKYAIVL